MNVYEYLPQVISIYFVLISRFTSQFLRTQVNRLLAPDPSLAAQSEFIENIAIDWANRLGFVTSIGAALVSVFPIYTNTKNFGLVAGTFFVLWIIFMPLLFWVMSFRPGDLVATTIKIRSLDITPETACNLILIFVNFILMIAIYLSQTSNGPSSVTVR